MLQRPQTFWILLAIISAVSAFELPFAISMDPSGNGVAQQLDAGSSVLSIMVSLASVALSGFTLMLYSNLKRQKFYCWIGILLGVVLCLSFLREWRQSPESSLTLTSILPAMVPCCLWLAWSGMDHDQKLIRKMSRNRPS